MKTVVVRKTEFGPGKPKICVPIVARTREEALAQAELVTKLPADVAEWRADWFEEAFGAGKNAQFTEEAGQALAGTAKELRRILGELPLLFTFRTADEGGERSMPAADYEAMNLMVARTGDVDLIDAELFTAWANMIAFCEELHEAGVKVIGSSHDFHKTPSKGEIVACLHRMQEKGVDIAKMAVMPQSRRDVLTLLEATLEMNEKYDQTPVITMAMGHDGSVSRLVGECFGSCLSFGSAGQASAPGQIQVTDLACALDIVHRM